MYCPWAVNIVFGWGSFAGLFCLYCLSVCLWREKLRILAHAAYLGLLFICLSGCWLYYHGVAHSNHFVVVCFFVWDSISKQKRSRDGKVCVVRKRVMVATQASKYGWMDGYVSRELGWGWGKSLCVGRQSNAMQARRKEVNEWIRIWYCAVGGEISIEESMNPYETCFACATRRIYVLKSLCPPLVYCVFIK
jgi:hypothetical protein